jgi:hypothetical protein
MRIIYNNFRDSGGKKHFNFGIKKPENPRFGIPGHKKSEIQPTPYET